VCREARCAIFRRFLCQPVHDDYELDHTEGTEVRSFAIPNPERADLLRYLEQHAEQYGLSSLRGLEGQGSGRADPMRSGVFGVLPPVTNGQGQRPANVWFVMSLSEGDRLGFFVYILHDGRTPGGLHCGESVQKVERLLVRALEDAAFDYERDRVWMKLWRHVERSHATAPAPDGAARERERERSGDSQEEDSTAAFTSFDLATLLCFSSCCALTEVDPQIALLLDKSLKVPWPDVMAYLQRSFPSLSMPVEGRTPEERDLLLACEAQALTATEAPPEEAGSEALPPMPFSSSVLVLISLRGSDVKLQLIRHSTSSRLSTHVRRQVARVIQRVLGYIWSFCLHGSECAAPSLPNP
jgi:hypothetical protein